MMLGEVFGEETRLCVVDCLSGFIDFPIMLDHGAAQTAPDGESVTFLTIKSKDNEDQLTQDSFLRFHGALEFLVAEGRRFQPIPTKILWKSIY